MKNLRVPITNIGPSVPFLNVSPENSMMDRVPRNSCNHSAIPDSPTTRKSSGFRGDASVNMQVIALNMYSAVQLLSVT